jgi:outer membrane lipoprotein-sorting protein
MRRRFLLRSIWLYSTVALLVLTVLTAAAGESADRAPLEKLLRDIQQQVDGTRTVQCSFEQERNLSLFAHPILFQGKMALVRPGQLRWENTDPIPSVLIFNNDEGMRCNDDADPVRFELDKDPIMKMVAEQIWTWLDGDYARLQSKYDITLTGEMAIELVPRNSGFAEEITSVTVEFDKQNLHPKTIKIMEAEGDSTLIRFARYRLNEPVADNLFSSCYP